MVEMEKELFPESQPGSITFELELNEKMRGNPMGTD